MALNAPLGNTSPEVLLDNATRLDNLLNSLALVFPDRAGADLDTWRGIMSRISNTLDDIRRNLVPLSRQYMTLPEAQADIANIPVGSVTFVRSTADDALADEYINIGGTLTATGRRMPSDIVVSKLIPLVALSETTMFRTMTELNDEYDSVVVDSEYNILIALKNGLFDFCGLSVNGKSINPAGILGTMDKTNLEVLSGTTEFSSASGEYELNPARYVILDEEKNIQFDLDEYIQRSIGWQQAYLFSLQPSKVNPYAPFTQNDGSGKSQVRVYDTENKKEIAVTSGNSNETNPRPDILNRIVWTSDRADNAPGGLFYADGPDFKEYPYIARPKIVGWGHSFMENGRFLSRLAQLTGLYTYNFGKSGLTSEGIASRQGAVRTFYMPAGGVIPASGAVTLSPAKPGPNRIFGNAAAASIACSFAGIDGMFGWDGTSATFTRTAAGATVTVSVPTPVIVYPITGFSVTNGAPGGTRYDKHDECMNLLWPGRNNISEIDLIISNTLAMASWLKSIGKRFVILPEFPAGTEPTGSTNNNYVRILNNLYKQNFPDNYCQINGVDLLQNFMNQYNPTSPGDIEDINNGVTPRSLRYDNLHPSQSISGSVTPEYALYAGADVNAEFVYNFMKLKGWVL